MVEPLIKVFRLDMSLFKKACEDLMNGDIVYMKRKENDNTRYVYVA